jgi:hypothetical protein
MYYTFCARMHTRASTTLRAVPFPDLVVAHETGAARQRTEAALCGSYSGPASTAAGWRMPRCPARAQALVDRFPTPRGIQIRVPVARSRRDYALCDCEPPLRITDSTVQSMGSLSGAVLRLAYSWLSWESPREALAYKSAPWLEVSSINFTVHCLA